MRHRRKNKKLRREKAARTALYRNLIAALFREGQIITTATKAKAIRPLAEKMITRAKEDNLTNRRTIYADLNDQDAARSLFSKHAPLHKNRSGGYLRIIKLGPRKSDDTMMAKIELTKKAAVAPKQLKPNDAQK